MTLLYRLIKQATFNDLELYAEMQPFLYDFTNTDLDYITATQISLYLSQLTYVLIGNIIDKETHPLLTNTFSSTFFEKMHNGRLFFLDLKQRMRKPIWKDKDITASIKLEKVKKTTKSFFGFITFSINKNSCVGSLKIGMEF